MYDALIIASGGSRGVAALGAIDALFATKFIDKAGITTYSGCSVGSVIAAGLALGRTPRSLLRAVQHYAIEPDLSPSNFGFDGGQGLHRWICQVLRIPAGGLTFAEAYRQTGKTLVVCVTNLDARRAEHWSYETHPTVQVADAVRISCSVPGVFAAVRHEGALYVDGAVADAFPVPRGSQTPFGIRLRPQDTADTAPQPVETLPDFLSALLECHKPVIDHGVPALCLRLTRLNAMNFALSATQMRYWFRVGGRQAAAFVKKNK